MTTRKTLAAVMTNLLLPVLAMLAGTGCAVSGPVAAPSAPAARPVMQPRTPAAAVRTVAIVTERSHEQEASDAEGVCTDPGWKAFVEAWPHGKAPTAPAAPAVQAGSRSGRALPPAAANTIPAVGRKPARPRVGYPAAQPPAAETRGAGRKADRRLSPAGGVVFRGAPAGTLRGPLLPQRARPRLPTADCRPPIADCVCRLQEGLTGW